MSTVAWDHGLIAMFRTGWTIAREGSAVIERDFRAIVYSTGWWERAIGFQMEEVFEEAFPGKGSWWTDPRKKPVATFGYWLTLRASAGLSIAFVTMNFAGDGIWQSACQHVSRN